MASQTLHQSGVHKVGWHTFSEKLTFLNRLGLGIQTEHFESQNPKH